MYRGYGEGAYADTGCQEAANFLSHDVQCIECPFGDCIVDLKPNEKRLIYQRNIVKLVFTYSDLGLSLSDIATFLPSITQAQIGYWIRNRKRIDDKINRYAPIGV